MKLLTTLLLATPILLSACATYDTTLTNTSNIQQIHCTNSGFGLLGSLVATVSHNQCVAKAKALGYVEAGN